MGDRLEKGVERISDEEFDDMVSFLHIFRFVQNCKAAHNGMNSGYVYVLSEDTYSKIYMADDWTLDHARNIDYRHDCQTFVGEIIEEDEYCVGFVGRGQYTIDVLESFCLKPQYQDERGVIYGAKPNPPSPL